MDERPNKPGGGLAVALIGLLLLVMILAAGWIGERIYTTRREAEALRHMEIQSRYMMEIRLREEGESQEPGQ
jgi:hypothetical protein